MKFFIKLSLLALITFSFLFSNTDILIQNLTPLAFNLSYQNFISLYKGKDLTNIYGDSDSYSKYLRTAYHGLPYTRAYYISEEIDKQPMNKTFLFHQDKLFLQSIQFITLPEDYKKIIISLTKQYGQPIKQNLLQKAKSNSTLWEFENKKILISYTNQSFAKNKDQNDSVLILLEAAFQSISAYKKEKANKVYQELKSNGFLNKQGILMKDLSNPQGLSFLNLSSLEEEIVRVSLMATKYGEVNIVYVNKKNLKEAMAIRQKEN